MNNSNFVRYLLIKSRKKNRYRIKFTISEKILQLLPVFCLLSLDILRFILCHFYTCDLGHVTLTLAIYLLAQNNLKLFLSTNSHKNLKKI